MMDEIAVCNHYHNYALSIANGKWNIKEKPKPQTRKKSFQNPSTKLPKAPSVDNIHNFSFYFKILILFIATISTEMKKKYLCI